ncbi:hypothetical protein Cgig2_007480 [Carnegiea gigantea]|uniref:Uncharacterized protein n=1 Tax=Carnegiea gigantea TaxID=171969 RepID=A0A9Q1QCS9_9CARY|nr:hypothetical protein Cgig2_007480 [Carnegiea gigantea]
MVTLKPAWLLERELPSPLLQVRTQLLTLPLSSKDLIKLLDKVGGLLSHVYQNPSKSIQDGLVPIKGILISEVLTNQADLDVRISLSLCLFERVRITATNSHFEDELMKKAFRVIVSSLEALPDSADIPYHKRLHILESMTKVKSSMVIVCQHSSRVWSYIDRSHIPFLAVKCGEDTMGCQAVSSSNKAKRS